MSTLPRIIPRSASDIDVTVDSSGFGCSGWLRLEPRSLGPASGERVVIPEFAPELFCTALPFFSCSFCDSWTICSRAVLMSFAEAFSTW